MRIVKAIKVRLPYSVGVNKDKGVWVDWFVLHLAKLRPQESLQSLTDLAMEVYPRLGYMDPIEAAQAEYDAPPPHRVNNLSHRLPLSLTSARQTRPPCTAGFTSKKASPIATHWATLS